MGTSGSAPDVSRDDVWRVFSESDEPQTPLTTGEVAGRLESSERTVRQTLEGLVERGEFLTREIGDHHRVWWRADDGEGSSTGQRSELEEFGAFVTAVEDYAIFTLDPDGTVASWNDGAERIKGYAEDDIVGQHFSTFYTDEDVADGVPEANLERAAERGRVEDTGWRIREDGSRFWATVTITAIRDDDGALRGFTKVTHDTTERRDFEQQLRRERDLTSQILETVPVSISVLTADGGFVRANARAIDRLGLDGSRVTDYNIRSWDLYDDDGEPVPVDEQPWKRVIETGEPVTGYRCQIDLPEIGRRWLSINAAPLTDDQEDDRVVVTVDDVTDRRERERQLRRERDQTEQLLRTVPVGIAVQNTDRETVRANQRAQETFGLSEREFRENPVDAGEWEMRDADGEPLDPDETPSARAIADEEPVFEEELVVERPDGERMDVTVNAAPIFGPDGDVERVVTAGQEITDLKTRERRLERRKSELETELSEIFDRISDAFYAVDDEWRFTHVNERAAEIARRPREELLGRKLWEIVPDGAEEVYGDDLRTAMETQEPATFERFIGWLDIWLEFNVYPSESGLSIYFRDVTDRKERERELERTERRFDAVFEDPNILVGLLEPDGTVLDINETAMEYVDADLDDVTGEPFWETPWWGEGDEVRNDIERWTERAAAGEYVDFETDLTDPAGQRYVLNGVFRPVTDDDGEVVSVIVSDRDVTEQREYERELAESERRYRTLVEHFPNGAVALVDADLRYQTVGGTPVAAGPSTADDLEGRHVREVLSPELADELVPAYEAALDGESATFETERAGRAYQYQVVPVRDNHGDAFAALGMSQDITERKERERELTKYETIVETIDDGIYVKDEDGYFTMVNDAYAEMTGYDRDELLGAHASLVVDESTVQESEAVETAPGADAGEEPTMEAPLQTADGGELPTEATFATFGTGDGRRKRVGVVRDITSRLEQRRRIEESERRHRTLVENFPDGAVGLFDDNLAYTAVGGQLLDTLDLSPEKRIGKSIDEIHPSDLLAEIGHHFEAALEGESREFEADYQGRHLHAHTLPVRDANDRVFSGMLVVQDVTQRREAQQELRKSEAKFQMIAENLEEVVWMATPDAEEFVYVNPAFERVWGRDRDALYDDSLSFLESVHSEDRERVRQAFAALPDEEFDEEFRIVRPDGEIRWVHARGDRVHDADAEMTRVVGTGQDVTERVERERELERSERRYRAVVENFPNGAVGLVDEDLRYVTMGGNPLTENDLTAADLEGNAVSEVLSPRLAEAIAPQYRAALDGEANTFEYEHESGDRYSRFYTFPVRDDGEVFGALGMSQDITDQVERERELERALDLLEKTERIADVGGWEIDTDTMDVFWSEHIFELLDVDVDEEPSLDEALDMYHDEDQSVVEEAIEHSLDTGDSFDVEVRNQTATGGEARWLRLQGTPETVDGEIVSLRGAAQDITERKRRERRLEELIDQLEASNERLEQFAYAASHDLQEPLRMVSSYLRLVEDRYADALDEDGREFIEFAVDGADRMRDMIEGLLQYSRVDTRGDPFEPVDVDAVLADVRDDLQVRIDETDAVIDAEPLPTVEGDGGQLRQVVQNLLDNAIEYSGEAPPHVEIAAERVGEMWEISVSDEGIGIDPDDSERVFEVFQSLHAPDDHSGTGIGLALCERIVERHGGDIRVDSEPGRGATFTFTLPATDEDD